MNKGEHTSIPDKKKFRRLILEWGEDNIREYPWRENRTPYRVLISEVLLTRTKADQVVPVYEHFMKTYPTIKDFLKIDISKVKEIIRSLGLLFRADMLKEISKKVKKDFDGKIPESLSKLKSLKGIGDYGGNAILCFGFGQKRPILDANFIRVYERALNVKPKTKTAKKDKFLWDFATEILPNDKFMIYNYAILDLGGQICRARKRECDLCPINSICINIKKK